MTMEGTESGFPYFSLEIYVSFRFWTGANLFWVKPRGGIKRTREGCGECERVE